MTMKDTTITSYSSASSGDMEDRLSVTTITSFIINLLATSLFLIRVAKILSNNRLIISLLSSQASNDERLRRGGSSGSFLIQ